MKHISSFLLMLLLCCPLLCRAAWEVGGDPVPAANLKDGMIVVFEAASEGASLGHYLQGSKNLLSTQCDETCMWRLVATGQTNEVTEQPTYYLKNLKSNGYLCGYESVTLDPKSELTPAIAFTIVSTADDSIGTIRDAEQISNQPWDENSVVLGYPYWGTLSDGSRVVNRRFLLNVGGGASAKTNTGSSRLNNAWNVYEVTYYEDAQVDLLDLITEFETYKYLQSYRAGNNPGNVSQARYDRLKTAFQTAYDEVANDHTQAEYKAYYDELIAAKKDCDENENPITDGYYYIMTANTLFTQNEKKPENANMAWYSNFGENPRWGMLQPTDPRYVFQLTRQDSNTYMVQCIGDGLYVNHPTANGLSRYVNATKEPTTAQVFVPLGSGEFNIHSADVPWAYCQNDHYNGSGTGGTLVTWYGAKDDFSAWYLVRVEDQALIDSMMTAAVVMRRVENRKNLLSEADEYIAAGITLKADRTKPVITSIDQVSANNQEEEEGPLAGLVDGDYTTYYCSGWSGAVVGGGTLDSTYHHIQVHAAEPLPRELMMWWCKRWGVNNVNRPVSVAILASNDGQNWTSIDTLSNPEAGFPTAATDSFYLSKAPINLGADYTYFRMEVLRTNNNATEAMGFPFFTMGEFQLYPYAGIDESLSQGVNANVKPSYDALKTEVARVRAIADSLLTDADVDALSASLEALKAVWADSTDLLSIIDDVTDNLAMAVAGDEVGQYPAEAITTLQAALDRTTARRPFYQVFRAEQEQLTADLTAALTTFLGQMHFVGSDKLYHIVCVGEEELSGDEDDPMYATNQLVYAAENGGPGYAVNWGGTEVENSQNARSAWRFIPQGDGTYAIQNAGTGWYMGANRGAGSGILLSDTIVRYYPMPMRMGQMALRPATGSMYLCTDAAHHISSWNMAPDSSLISANAFVVREVKADEMTDLKQFVRGQMAVVTVPYHTLSLPYDAEGGQVSVYTLAGADKDAAGTVSALKLAAFNGTQLEPGVPYIVKIDGDYDVEDTVYVDMGFDAGNVNIVNEAQNVNGLVGTFRLNYLKAAGYGYFQADSLMATTDSTTATITPGSGWIVAHDVADTGAAVDLTLPVVSEGGIINHIGRATVSNTDRVNVYTIDGVLLKRNVEAAGAAQGLKPGLYIIGNKKVYLH